MRLISQEGTLDLPYENIGITIGHRCDSKEFYIFAHLVNSAEPKKDPQKLASYSTESKAQKAMLDLIEFYTDSDIHNRAFQFPKDEDVEE